jgi:hypothetical protein
LPKAAILEAYLNSVYLGHGCYGAAKACLGYFGKGPGEVQLGEAALLAALLPAPEHISPFRNPRRDTTHTHPHTHTHTHTITPGSTGGGPPYFVTTARGNSHDLGHSPIESPQNR